MKVRGGLMKTIRTMALPLVGLLGVLGMPEARAHPGGLNAEGCHNDRKKGEYHCHRGSSTPQRSPQTQKAQAFVGSGSRAFANCSEARAAGAAPVRRGDPGYGSHLDRDNDGIGCE